MRIPKNRRIQKNRRGFTLVELLVVMSIIAMLAGLLLPAVNSVRETGRKTTCANNIRNIAIALQNHEAQRGCLPGWANRQDARVMYLSWYDGAKFNPVVASRGLSYVFPILPYLEKDDIFRAYSIPSPGDTTKVNANNQVMHSNTQPIEHIKILTCPNDTSALNNGASLSYVANCGLRDRLPLSVDPSNDANVWENYRELPSSALFHNAYPTVSNLVRGSIQIASSGDGASSTFLLSENMDATSWNTYNERETGFCWPAVATSPATTTTTSGAATMAPNHGPIGVNEGNLPRASSYHPGGFTVAFADSHVSFMNSNIDWTVYIRLFTPRGDSVTHIPVKDASTYPASPTIDTEVMKIQSQPISETF